MQRFCSTEVRHELRNVSFTTPQGEHITPSDRLGPRQHWLVTDWLVTQVAFQELLEDAVADISEIDPTVNTAFIRAKLIKRIKRFSKTSYFSINRGKVYVRWRYRCLYVSIMQYPQLVIQEEVVIPEPPRLHVVREEV